jgi:hypothetical protein
MSALYQSDIFRFKFDYDEWPTTHTDPEKYIRAYNGSLFRLRENYKAVFYEKKFKPIEDSFDDAKDMDMTKVYKVKYSVNLLPTIGEYIRPANKEKGEERKVMNEGCHLMGFCVDSDELDIFETVTIL